MPNTITLPTGDIVYDINGEWATVIDDGSYGTDKDILKITQEGNKFVGILLIGNAYLDKGSELIKGELEKNGFKSIQRNTGKVGWISESIGKINESCNKIEVKTKFQFHTFVVTLTKK